MNLYKPLLAASRLKTPSEALGDSWRQSQSGAMPKVSRGVQGLWVQGQFWRFKHKGPKDLIIRHRGFRIQALGPFESRASD